MSVVSLLHVGNISWPLKTLCAKVWFTNFRELWKSFQCLCVKGIDNKGYPYYLDCMFIVFCYFVLLPSPACFAASFSYWSIPFLLLHSFFTTYMYFFFVSITLLTASNLYFLIARCSFFTSVFQHLCKESLLLALIINNPCSFSVPLIISICLSSCLRWWQAFLVLVKHVSYMYDSLWMLIDFRILTAIIFTLCVQSVANVFRDINWIWATLLHIFALCLITFPNWCPTYLSGIRYYQNPAVTCYLWEKYCNREAVPMVDPFHGEAHVTPEEKLSWFEEMNKPEMIWGYEQSLLLVQLPLTWLPCLHWTA